MKGPLREMHKDGVKLKAAPKYAICFELFTSFISAMKREGKVEN
jgi:hypothetical protein